MDKPVLLDLFCGAGGAGEGYARAGFRVVGCDRDPKPLRHNPHECYQGDALDVLNTLLVGGAWQGYRLRDFAAIHASPPCQDYSSGAHISRARRVHPEYPRLLAPIRERLKAWDGIMWVMENVGGAALTDKEMDNPLRLCGTTFGLRVWRHRYFESNILLFGAGACHHQTGDVSVRRKRAEYIGIQSSATYTDGKGRTRYRPKSCRFADAMAAMNIDWPMSFSDLGEAIPPAYTAWIGAQLMSVVATRGAA